MRDDVIADDELEALDLAVRGALASGDLSGLAVLGFGELSVALGWPVDEPRFVCKRTPPFTPPQFAAYRDTVVEYVDRLRAAGLDVVDTSVRSIEHGSRVHAYLVQPMLDPSTLGERVLGGATPDPDHPYLRALAEVLSIVTPHLSVDAQVTNFSFDGERLTLVDVGTPFLWDDTGSLQFDLGPFLRMLSAPLRPIVAREMHKTVQRWREPRTVAVDIVANLYREQMPEWVEPTIDAMNRRWQWEAPIEAGEAQAIYDEDRKLWPLLKRLQAVERGWQHKVRRRPYDFFIHSTFADREHRPSA